MTYLNVILELGGTDYIIFNRQVGLTIQFGYRAWQEMPYTDLSLCHIGVTNFA